MIVALSWNPNTEQDLLGYRIYAGQSSGIYTHTFDVLGTVFPFLPVFAPISQAGATLPDGILWYVAITAVDTSNNESIKSDEVTIINKFSSFSL